VAREVKIDILGDARDFGRAAASARSDASRLDDSFARTSRGAGRMAAGVALGAVGVGVAVGGMALSFLHAAEESAQVSRQTVTAFENMGASAWTSVEQIEALSTSLSNQTGIDDELIQSGQNLLLTFDQIQNRVGEGNDVFDRATEAALDMSVALGTDMAGASQAVGRALQDPLKGLQRLQRQGVSFTEQQRDQVEAMMEAGDIAGAQSVILGELERQYGGSAEAQATASDRLSTIWGNLQEQLGEKLLPLAEKFADWMADELPGAIEKAEKFVGDLVDKGKEFTAWLEDHGVTMKDAAQIIGGVLVGAFVLWAASATAAALATLAAALPVILVTAAIGLLIAGLIYAYNEWDTFRNAVDTVWKFLKDSVWPNLKEGARIVKDVLADALTIAKNTFNDLKSAAETAWPAIKAAFEAAKGPIMGVLNPIIAAIRGAKDAWDQLQQALNAGTANKQVGNVNLNGGVSGRASSTHPKFHGGGMFRAPTPGGQGLAMLRDREQILTPGQALAGGGTPILVQVLLDGDVVADSLTRYTNRGGVLQVRVA
jgi:hypothetical protein